MKKKMEFISITIWYEMNANKNANKYFNKHYGNRVNWSLYEPSLNHFPTKKPKKKKI
jgi:hypothetical protein